MKDGNSGHKTIKFERVYKGHKNRKTINLLITTSQLPTYTLDQVNLITDQSI